LRTVSVKPGFTSLTVIPYSPRPAASDFVSVRSVPFAVECGMRVQHAGQCGVEVEGAQVSTTNWFLNLPILTSGGFR
jgi:hypothetical protein